MLNIVRIYVIYCKDMLYFAQIDGTIARNYYYRQFSRICKIGVCLLQKCMYVYDYIGNSENMYLHTGQVVIWIT